MSGKKEAEGAKSGTWPKAASSELRAEWRAAYLSYHKLVWRCLAGRGVPRDQLLDLAQLVFETAFRNWDDFRGESERGRWIVGIARWTALDASRRRQRSGVVLEEPCRLERNARSLWGAAPATVEKRTIDREQCERIDLAVADLPATERRLFIMVIVEGHQCAAAARQIGIEQRRAYSLLESARKSVRAAIRRER